MKFYQYNTSQNLVYPIEKHSDIVEINSLEELLKLVNECMDEGIIISKTDNKEIPYSLEIYDNYRE